MKTNTFQFNRKLKFAGLLVLAFSFSNVMKAQQLSFGPKLGITSTTGAGDDVPSQTESITNIVGGVFFKVGSDGIFSFQPEILYHPKGGVYEDDNFRYELNIDYLEIPLLFKVQIPVGETVYPFVYAGPYGAFELGNEETGEFFIFQGTGTADISDFDAGAVLGAGLDFQVSNMYLGLDLRYGIGMVNIYDAEDPDDQPDIKNRAFSVMVGLGINL